MRAAFLPPADQAAAMPMMLTGLVLLVLLAVALGVGLVVGTFWLYWKALSWMWSVFPHNVFAIGTAAGIFFTTQIVLWA